MENLFLGIDTSNYTTSLALITEDGELLANIKKLLPVAPGERGLRQSDAVFAHIKNLPTQFDDVKKIADGRRICAVGVSERPRNLEGSYMPCFLVGSAMARGICATTGAKLFSFSHQCGHIMSAVYSSKNFDILNNPFAAFHISGGTTELIRVEKYDKRTGFTSSVVGGTKDLNAGQVIDRVGVLMGLPFPAGAHMEKLALANDEKIPKRKISCENREVNLSGLENIASDMYKKHGDKALVSAFVFDYVGRAIIEMADAYISDFGSTRFVFGGGVMSNSIIKGMLAERYDCSFAEPAMSSDNAVGIAYLARNAYLSKEE